LHEPNHRVLNDVERLVAIANVHERNAVRSRFDVAQESLDLCSRDKSPLPAEARFALSDTQC
jgi:hypothetical protein